MRKLFFSQMALLICFMHGGLVYASSGETASGAITEQESLAAIAKVQQLLAPESRTGSVILAQNQATLHVPEGYVYLSASGASLVLEDMWGNSHDDGVLGLIVPVGFPEKDKEWGVVISYRDSGYISDDDATELLDSAKLLKSLQDTQTENNISMKKEGLVPFDIVGWLDNPQFDSVNKKLSWGLRMQSEDEDKSESLNYEIRILGREGYMNLEGLGGISELPKVKAESEKMMKSIEFNPGKRYADYNPSTDKLAEYGLLGLVGGGLIAKKIGIFAILLKFSKVIIIALIAIIAKMKTRIKALFGRLFGKKDEEVMVSNSEKTEDLQ